MAGAPPGGQGVCAKSELLNLLGDVKARVQDKLGTVDFPMPQFILIGKQSVGKSRLIEALAGETFNFISGSLGSRRPTVLEFRHVASIPSSRWFVRDRQSMQWNEYPIKEVMKLVGDAHEELGESVSVDPIGVRIESPSCVDMQIVDLPGFRDFALDDSKQALSNSIHDMVYAFMQNPRNTMLCVEQCGDAATMSTLQKARTVDPEFKRTILIRTKLDKYYSDLTPENVNKWVDGFGDLPDGLDRFSLTLPFWKDGEDPPKAFADLREEKNQTDISTLQSKGIEGKLLSTIGFKNFVTYMDKKIEHLFVDAIQPVLDDLKELKATSTKKEQSLATEFEETDPVRILSTTRDCAGSFASGLNFIMEGKLGVDTGAMTLEQELKEFHEHHSKSENFIKLPTEDFCSLADYIEYLKEVSIGACTMEVNGGAQFRRLMAEVEIFLRFSEIAVETKKRDVIQAHGVSMTSLTWRDVVVKLLSNEAHLPLQHRVRYVGERLKRFFEMQKDVVLDWMSSLEKGGATTKMYSSLYPKHVKLIKQNEIIRHHIFQTFDTACERQLGHFLELFESMLTSTFANPWVFLKGATVGDGSDGSLALGDGDDVDVKERIPLEIQSRSGIESTLSKWLQDIPTEAHQIDEAVDKVQMLVLKTYSFIRSQVCDQVELFAESFFKMPMLRRLSEDMANITLSETDKANYKARRERLDGEMKAAQSFGQEVHECIERLETFQMKSLAHRGL
mmetsp:Transcript_64954/g.139107  ORF Transcript_64954/g.139107 Transcript_64954/m.139107 type:complete len:733 (-) Transcript_64954:12-2210(-)